MTTTALSAVQHKLHERLLDQMRADLRAGALAAVDRTLEALLGEVSGERAWAALCLRLLRALAAGGSAEAANLAYYLTGGVDTATRRAVLADQVARLGDWPLLDQLEARRDPDRLLARLAAEATPRPDPAGAAPDAARAPDGAAPVVVLTVINGFGNQLFQYAAALRRARRCGGRLALDLSVFSMAQYYNRPYGLDAFALSAGMAGADDVARGDRQPHSEELVALDRGVLAGEGDCRMIGCWAHPVYFAGIEAQLRQEFRFKDPAVGARASAAIDALRRPGAPVVGMHVRRGDYLWPTFKNSYAAHPTAYYRAALARFPADAVVVLFSDTPDDRAWCAETFADLGTRLHVSRDRADIDDFALLAACDHQIVSVSSFSWWAAWLNPNPAKRVVAPHPAIGLGPRLGHVLTAGRMPPEWTVLTMDDVVAHSRAGAPA
jgi:hypothetical protein